MHIMNNKIEKAYMTIALKCFNQWTTKVLWCKERRVYKTKFRLISTKEDKMKKKRKGKKKKKARSKKRKIRYLFKANFSN